MKNNNSVELQTQINAKPEAIWKVLTDEAEFSKCFTALEIECQEWKVGGEIIFKVKNSEFFDRAIITKIQDNICLSYQYFKSKSTNFIEMSFDIHEDENQTSIALKGKNFVNDEEYNHSKIAWTGMLNRLKEFLGGH